MNKKSLMSESIMILTGNLLVFTLYARDHPDYPTLHNMVPIGGIGIGIGLVTFVALKFLEKR